MSPTGVGWRHRIDEVPMVGETVEVFTKDDRQFQATVVNATDDDPFMGVGCGVAYQTDEGYLSASHVSYWRRIVGATRPSALSAW